MAAPAQIICFHKGGRRERRNLVNAGEAPRDFFYGFLAVEADGYAVDWRSTAEIYPGVRGRAIRRLEVAHAVLSGVAWRPHYFHGVGEAMRSAKLAVSLTDQFSLSLGRWGCATPVRPFLVGLFHGLSDIEERAPAAARPYVRWHIRRAAAGLDRMGFLSAADRLHATRRYAIDPARTFIFGFGVDQLFWSPAAAQHDGTVLAVGSDPNRDYQTLLRAVRHRPLRIVTDLPLPGSLDGGNVEVLRGSFSRPAVSDAALRDLYRKALCVVVPLRDCFQPSGQSVTLQAMACGAAVVLTRNRGLWAPDLLRDGENCLLVPPGDTAALADAVERLSHDEGLRQRLRLAARRTVEGHFSLSLSEASAQSIVAMTPDLSAQPTYASRGAA